MLAFIATLKLPLARLCSPTLFVSSKSSLKEDIYSNLKEDRVVRKGRKKEKEEKKGKEKEKEKDVVVLLPLVATKVTL
ncbi:hypothetical protein VE03_10912 [Pseudogymnoascus sp. 23342-1-I1]|nr:hypothetical protein VE03_10912 [Pseudogymnoascus sp. 23342-1-I1]